MSFATSQSLKGSSRKLKGSSQCSFASLTSVSRSSRSLETSAGRQNRIDDQLRGVEKGDMIQIERTGFLHYAIYIGQHKIVDFVADNGGEVDSRNLYEAVGDCNCIVDNYLDKEHDPLPQDEIVRRAKYSIAEDFTYDLGRFNCEHFATWCRYNIKHCHQPCEIAATLGAIF